MCTFGGRVVHVWQNHPMKGKLVVRTTNTFPLSNHVAACVSGPLPSNVVPIPHICALNWAELPYMTLKHPT